MPYPYYPNESKTRLPGSAKVRDFIIANVGTSPKPYTGKKTSGVSSGGTNGGTGKTETGKGKSSSFLDPFAKWPRKDAQSKGIKQTWHRRFKRKPGRRGAPAIAGKKIYALR